MDPRDGRRSAGIVDDKPRASNYFFFSFSVKRPNTDRFLVFIDLHLSKWVAKAEKVCMFYTPP